MMQTFEALKRYADVVKLDQAERVLIDLVTRGFKMKDVGEGLYLSPSQASRAYHNARIKLETAIKVERWLTNPAPPPELAAEVDDG